MFLFCLVDEICCDMLECVIGLDNCILVVEIECCYIYVVYELGIICLLVLVWWMKIDVGSGGVLYCEMMVDLIICQVDDFNLVVVDLLVVLVVFYCWFMFWSGV